MQDLISRQAAIDALDRIFDRCEEIEAHLPEGDPDRTGYKMYPDYMTVWKYLHQLSSAQPERPKGEWKATDDGWDGTYYVCSECGCPWTLIDGTPKDNGMNFCPNCGADMRGGQDELQI